MRTFCNGGMSSDCLIASSAVQRMPMLASHPHQIMRASRRATAMGVRARVLDTSRLRARSAGTMWKQLKAGGLGHCSIVIEGTGGWTDRWLSGSADLGCMIRCSAMDVQSPAAFPYRIWLG